MASPVVVIPGESPLVLVAPHGGRRDPRARPWAGGHLRVNDLHTASLARELATLAGAAAVVNEGHDRNDVDLNRIVEAHERAPGFLERLADVIDATVARHGRATLLALHGWNVAQPVVDLGVGCAPGPDPFAVGRGAAVTREFAAGVLPQLVSACRAHAIGATVGARYPARHRENLIQLFTARYADDPRPLVRALAAHAPRVDAVQLELGIPLRWPGAWRTRLLAAIGTALPALTAPGTEAVPAVDPVVDPEDIVPCRLEFTAPALCGLLGIDGGRGGRLLFFPPDGGLALFTGERIGLEPAGTAGRLDVHTGSGITVRFAGPLLRFPETTPFLDLEAGLATAHVVDADVALDVVPAHPGGGRGDFGTIRGTVVLDGVRHAIAGDAFLDDGAIAGPWPRVRAALRLADDTRLAVTMGLDGNQASGFLCRDGTHVPVVAARATLAAPDAPFERVGLTVELVDGTTLHVNARAAHRLPVIRARGTTPLRLEFAACRLDGATSAVPAGWLEAGGL